MPLRYTAPDVGLTEANCAAWKVFEVPLGSPKAAPKVLQKTPKREPNRTKAHHFGGRGTRYGFSFNGAKIPDRFVENAGTFFNDFKEMEFGRPVIQFGLRFIF